jgi:hypothetical protein
MDEHTQSIQTVTVEQRPFPQVERRLGESVELSWRLDVLQSVRGK